MSDEYQLQITRKGDKSSLASSSAISSLVARGRRDAAFLTLHARAESEERRSGLLGWPALWDQIEKPTEDVQREAEQGYAPAQFNLGWRYDNRYLGVPGVGQDYAEAARWYRRAADQGLAPAQFNLGVMYDMGEGVGRDYAQAARWYRKAAEQCVAPAQFNLGIKYENGEGVAQDATEAVAWYRKAAEQGFCKAQFNLGLKYVSGDGVAQDYVQAHAWISLAAPRANLADGKRYAATRDSLAAKMSPPQVAEARRLALAWVTKRRDESIAKEGSLAVGCNKCGERNELVFAGCVCASCSEALDRKWGSSTVTDWLVTRPDNPVGNRVSDFVLLDTSYAQMKKYCWAANDEDSRIQGFFRFRQATAEELSHFQSQPRAWSHASGARIVRPANPDEVAAYKQNAREWLIASETDFIIRDTCERLGVPEKVYWEPPEAGERDDPGRVQAAREIGERLQHLGWLEELAKMVREGSDALQVVDDARLLDIVLGR